MVYVRQFTDYSRLIHGSYPTIVKTVTQHTIFCMKGGNRAEQTFDIQNLFLGYVNIV